MHFLSPYVTWFFSRLDRTKRTLLCEEHMAEQDRQVCTTGLVVPRRLQLNSFFSVFSVLSTRVYRRYIYELRATERTRIAENRTDDLPGYR